jgi:hypothetical protein
MKVLNLIRLTIILCIIGTLTGTIYASDIYPPASYTKSAHNKLDYAIKHIENYKDKYDWNSLNKDEKAKVYVGYFKKMYNMAGFSLEKSIIQVAEDLKNDKFIDTDLLFVAQTSLINTIFIVAGFNDERKEIPIDKYLNPETIQALDYLAKTDKKIGH